MENQNQTAMFSEYTDIVGIKELTEMLKIGRNRAYILLKEGAIKSKKIGKSHIIAKRAVIRFLEDIT